MSGHLFPLFRGPAYVLWTDLSSFTGHTRCRCSRVPTGTVGEDVCGLEPERDPGRCPKRGRNQNPFRFRVDPVRVPSSLEVGYPYPVSFPFHLTRTDGSEPEETSPTVGSRRSCGPGHPPQCPSRDGPRGPGRRLRHQ